MYLKSFRDKTQTEQQNQYFISRTKHTFTPEVLKSPKGVKMLLGIEGTIRQIYKEQSVSREDLEIRDKVIANIKNAFKNTSDREYPAILTG